MIHTLACIMIPAARYVQHGMYTTLFSTYTVNLLSVSSDRHQQYYYNSETQQYLYWDSEKQAYLPAPTDKSKEQHNNSASSSASSSKEPKEKKEKPKSKSAQQVNATQLICANSYYLDLRIILTVNQIADCKGHGALGKKLK